MTASASPSTSPLPPVSPVARAATTLFLRPTAQPSLPPAFQAALDSLSSALAPAVYAPDAPLRLAALARLKTLGLPTPHNEAFTSVRLSEILPRLTLAPQALPVAATVSGLHLSENQPWTDSAKTAWNKDLGEETDAASLIALAFSSPLLWTATASPTGVEALAEITLHWPEAATSSHQAFAAGLQIPAGQKARVGLHSILAGSPADRLLNASLWVQVEANASLHFCVTDAEGGDGLRSLTRLRFHLEAGASLHLHLGTTGNALARTSLQVDLAGPGAHAEILGTAALTGQNQAHRHLLIRHLAPHATSRQLFKTVLAEKSRSSVDGTIEVAHGAKGTAAGQTLRNLLLSDEARADSKPRLLIRNDDVKCNHGATTGRLDEAQRFYLRSRGLTDAQAVALLTGAFLQETLQDVPAGPHRLSLDRTLHRLLTTALKA